MYTISVKTPRMRNYNPVFIDGSKNLCASSFKDVVSDMHARAMLLLKRVQFKDICDYAPIAKAWHTMDTSVEQQMGEEIILYSQ